MSTHDTAHDLRSRSPERDPKNESRKRSRSPRPDRHEDSPSKKVTEPNAADHAPPNPDTDSEDFQDDIKDHARYLRRHLGLAEAPGLPAPKLRGDTIPVFFVEIAPWSSRGGSKCKLPGCDDAVAIGSYRIALCPSMSPAWYGSRSTDFYHIEFFEKIAGFSQSDINKRLLPLTRRYTGIRGLTMTQIMDGNNNLDGGAERLIQELKIARGELLDAQDGVTEAEDEEPINPALLNLLDKAGSANFKHKPLEGVNKNEEELLLTVLAPWQSDGPEDDDEWNLFDQYPVLGDVEDRHTLSETLRKWKFDRTPLNTPDEKLPNESKALKEKLSETARRAIRRLSAAPTLGGFRTYA